MEQQKITRSATLFGAFTFISRILGMVRDIVIARLFGTSFAMSAYTIAFTVPNLFRRLFGEGTLVGAFVPVFSEELHNQGEKPAFSLAGRMIPFMFVMLSLIALGIILGIALLRLLFPFSEQARLVFSLIQVMMPYMILICTAALFMGILNSLNHFAVPALSPCVLNLSLIFAALVVCPLIPGSLETKIYGLAGGVLLGGLLQFLFHFPILKKKGIPLFQSFNIVSSFKNPTIRRIFKLMIPGIIGLSINQFNVIIDRFLACVISDSAAAVLFYGDRLVEFPLGIFGIAIATAVLPSLSRYAAKNDIENLKIALVYALRQVLFITVPATVGLIVLGKPIVELLFQRGAFSAASTHATASVLTYYALGLCAYSAIKITIPAFYAMKDMKTPVKIGVVAMGVNLVLNVTLMQFMQERGLALSTAVSAMLNIGLLLYFLIRKIGPLNYALLKRSLYRISIVSLLTGGIAWLTWRQILQQFGHETLVDKLASTFGAIGVAILGYFVLSALFHLPELKELHQALLHRPKTLPASETTEDPPLRGE